MDAQLHLIETEPDWHLDERTREVGRAGIRAAREALRTARRARTGEQPHEQPDAA